MKTIIRHIADIIYLGIATVGGWLVGDRPDYRWKA